jgi:putative ABC transport system ATP-binding protein
MTEQTLGWGCELRNVLVERHKGGDSVFRLVIPHLLLRQNGTALNKLPIMGVSGAGKSTLMNIMGAIEWPHRLDSEVRWTFPDGTEVSWGGRGVGAEQMLLLRQRHFGFAFQSNTLIPHLTIEENLAYPLEIRGTPRSKALEQAAAVLHRVVHTDVGGILRSYPHQLSGGELQRAALIQSMVHDPAVLFADEPTGSLDPKTRRVVMRVLTDWVDSARHERMLIWVTHHANDPRDHDVDIRLDVSDGSCRWQSWNGRLGDWEDQDADC